MSFLMLNEPGRTNSLEDFEEAFGEYYSEEGRPAKPVRLMVGLLLVKQMCSTTSSSLWSYVG